MEKELAETPPKVINLLKKLLHEKNFWQNECKELNFKISNMEKNSEELKRSIEEEHALRLELQNQCMESKKQIIQQKISEQNALLTKKIKTTTRVGKLVDRANKKLEKEIDEIRNKKIKASFVAFGFKKDLNEKEKLKQLKKDKNTLLYELETAEIKIALLQKHLTQMEMYLDEVSIEKTKKESEDVKQNKFSINKGNMNVSEFEKSWSSENEQSSEEETKNEVESESIEVYEKIGNINTQKQHFGSDLKQMTAHKTPKKKFFIENEISTNNAKFNSNKNNSNTSNCFKHEFKTFSTHDLKKNKNEIEELKNLIKEIIKKQPKNVENLLLKNEIRYKMDSTTYKERVIPHKNFESSNGKPFKNSCDQNESIDKNLFQDFIASHNENIFPIIQNKEDRFSNLKEIDMLNKERDLNVLSSKFLKLENNKFETCQTCENRMNASEVSNQNTDLISFCDEIVQE